MISLELVSDDMKNPDCLEMYIDEEGLNDLIKMLHRLKERKIDHYDLFSESWGGIGIISGKALRRGNVPIQYLKIDFRDKL